MRLKKIILFLFPIVLFSSCLDFDEYDNDPQGNFEALWKIMDEHYCFFDSKGVDWDKVHRDYSARIQTSMGTEELFYLLSEMLSEVRDGHVNLVSGFEVGRYEKWYQDSITNFNVNLLKESRYLGYDYSIASGLKYKILDDNIGYIYYESFSSAIGEGNLDYVIKKFESCQGLIIDVRDNTGGSLTNVDILASRFTNEKILTGYIMHKTGSGHNDFSEPYPRYLEPTNRLSFQKPVVVLTSRQCYSATNDFVSVMKQLPTVCIMGTTTGGGGGLPFSAELPNGWSVRFSASPQLDSNKKNIEEGIAPDVYVTLQQGSSLDNVIETARKYVREKAGF